MAGYTKKAIKSICRNKIDDLCKHISKNNKDLADNFKKHCFISGGAITSLLQGDQPNDFDIYIDNLDVLAEIGKYYTNQWNENHKNSKVFDIIKHEEDNKRLEIIVRSSGIVEEDKEIEDEYNDEYDGTLPPKEIIDEIDTVEELKNEKYRVKCITSNAISLSDNVQIVCRFCGTPEEIFENYDFIHTMQAYVRINDELLLNVDSLVSIMCKRLEYKGSLFPICSLFRLRKFLSRGWTISSIEILKMAHQISKLNLDDVNVLKEQCIGCDYFYMVSFCNALSEWRENNPNIEFSNEYMFELIEKVFDKDYSLSNEE